MDNGGVPWKEHLFQLEKEQGIEGQIMFALFADDKGMWRVQAVPNDPAEGFSNRFFNFFIWNYNCNPISM